MLSRRSMLGALAALPAIAAGIFALPAESAALLGRTEVIRRRLSVDDADPGFPAFALLCAQGKKVTVYLDGVIQAKVRTADVSAGFVERYVLSPRGEMMVDLSINEVRKERVYGKVEIFATDPRGAGRLETLGAKRLV